MKLQLRNDEGEIIDEYEPADHDYYEVRTPDGVLVCELGPEE